MKNIYTLLIILCLSFPAYGQADAPVAGTVRVEPVTFAEEGDSLVVELDIHLCRDAVNNRQSWTIAPRLTSDERTLTLPYLLINGKQKARHYRRRSVFGNDDLRNNPPCVVTSVPKGTDTVLRYSTAVPYELWMDTARLEMRQELFSPAGKRQLFITGGFGRVALEPHEPYVVAPRVNYLTPEREDKQRRMQGQAFLDFRAGQSVLLPEYRRNPEELAKIAGAVMKIQNDPDVAITAIYIEGYASPEGSYALNERLSRERAAALRDYMSRSFGLDPDIFRVSSVAEDWDGLRQMVVDSSIPQKDRIFSIIDSEDDYDRKEARLRSLGGPWRTMLGELFPALRRVEYRIDFSVKDYSVEESRRLASTSPGQLSQRELYVLAQSYPAGSPERDEILDMVFRLYPDDATATINSAAVMLGRGEDATAKRYLDRVAGDPRASNNLGVYWLRAGDLETAESYFRQAETGGVAEAVHNLGEVRRKREDNEIMARYNRQKH